MKRFVMTSENSRNPYKLRGLGVKMEKHGFLRIESKTLQSLKHF